MKHLDLFSGIGGFALAAKWAGIETVAFCEINPFCREVLKKHWPGVLKYMDIRDVANPDHVDILTAGFPCQPFSMSGKRKGSEDERYLWPEVMRIIRKSLPHWIILENVSGIVSHLDPILEDLESQEYQWETFIIPASANGAPHKRERVWIIANRYSERCECGCDYREGRPVQADWKRHIQTVYQEWEKHISQSWKTMSANELLQANAGFMRINDGLPNRVDRIKALGNAVVPHIPFIFMSFIKLLSS